MSLEDTLSKHRAKHRIVPEVEQSHTMYQFQVYLQVLSLPIRKPTHKSAGPPIELTSVEDLYQETLPTVLSRILKVDLYKM